MKKLYVVGIGAGDPDGMTLVDSGVGVYDDSVYLDFLIIEDGEYFIIEYLFDPA